MDAALFSTFVIGGVSCLFTAVSFWTIDRYGRKPLYIGGSLGMCLSLVLLILCFTAGTLNPLRHLRMNHSKLLADHKTTSTASRTSARGHGPDAPEAHRRGVHRASSDESLASLHSES